MEPFLVHRGIAAPLDRSDVDTDAILPKQFMKSLGRTGLGPFAFDEWRHRDPGHLGIDPATRRIDAGFVLNDLRYRGASILVTGRNFGCGSSREHAVWALREFGFRVIVAESFAEIFAANAVRNGLLPVTMDRSALAPLLLRIAARPRVVLTIDLVERTIADHRRRIAFAIDPSVRERMMAGRDEIGDALRRRDDIAAFEARQRGEQPWMWEDARRSPDA